MRSGKKYNLFNIRTGEYELKFAQAKDIKAFLNMDEVDISYACRMGRIFFGKYTLEIASLETRQSDARRLKKEIPDELLEEWAEVTKALRDKIIWIPKEEQNAKIRRG